MEKSDILEKVILIQREYRKYRELKQLKELMETAGFHKLNKYKIREPTK